MSIKISRTGRTNRSDTHYSGSVFTSIVTGMEWSSSSIKRKHHWSKWANKARWTVKALALALAPYGVVKNLDLVSIRG
jgi:hypothetical protein